MEEIYPCATKSGSDEQYHHQHTTSCTPEVSFMFTLWDNLNLKTLGTNLGRRDGTVSPNIRANLITNIFSKLNVCLVHVINLVLGLSLQTWEQYIVCMDKLGKKRLCLWTNLGTRDSVYGQTWEQQTDV